MLTNSESQKFKSLCVDIGLAIENISVYLSNRNSREDREAKLSELKTLVTVVEGLPYSVREQVREKIEKLVRELV